MREIPLTQGKVALVDDADYDRLSQWNWYAAGQGKRFYAHRTPGTRKTKSVVCMHRLIMDAPKGMLVDHIDGNGLNNQRANLRLCSHAENLRNRGKNSSNKSGYKGVSWAKRCGKWVATIHLNGKKRHLGCFECPIKAAKAYDMAAELLHGKFARVNFPEDK